MGILCGCQKWGLISMKRIFIGVMFFTLFAKLFGFLREVLLAYFFGASSISDAYLISISVPNTFFLLISAAISAGFIPLYTKIQKDANEEQALSFANKLMFIILFINLLIVTFIQLFPDEIIYVFASGFSDSTREVAKNLLRVTSLSLFMTSIVAVLSGFLQINNKFIIPAMIGIPLNIIMILSFYFSRIYGLSYLSFGYIVAILSQLLILFPFAIKYGFRFKIIKNAKDDNLIFMLAVMLPVFVGVAVTEINGVIDRTIASQIIDGGISSINYAFRLNGFVQGIVVTSLISITYPTFSRLAIEKDYQGINSYLLNSIKVILLVVIPVSFVCLVYSTEIIQLVYGRGQMGKEAVSQTAGALFFYALGMVPFGLRALVTRVFYVLHDMKTPTLNAVFLMILNIVLNLIFFKFTSLGIGGIAFATSIVSWIMFVSLLISLSRKIGGFESSRLISDILKIICVSLFLIGVIFLSKILLSDILLNQSLVLFASFALGAVSFLLVSYVIDVDGIRGHVNEYILRLFKGGKI